MSFEDGHKRVKTDFELSRHAAYRLVGLLLTVPELRAIIATAAQEAVDVIEDSMLSRKGESIFA